MLTIECPNCKRGLRAPDESGDHRVVCPACNVAFAVLAEDGVVRTFSTSVSLELPVEEPTSGIDQTEPSVLLPSINRSVYEDEGVSRTRRIHRVFKIGFFVTLAFFLYMLLSEQKRPFEWWEILAILPVLTFVAFIIGGGVALVVGNLLSPMTETHKRGEEALRRMWKAYDEPPPPPDPHEAADGSAAETPH